MGLGAFALGAMLNPSSSLSASPQVSGGILGAPHFAPKAKRVIYLFQSGGPSQFETFRP